MNDVVAGRSAATWGRDVLAVLPAWVAARVLVAVGYVPWIAVVVGVVWLAVGAQLTTLAAGRYAPYPSAGRRGPRNPLQALRSRRRVRLEQVDALEG